MGCDGNEREKIMYSDKEKVKLAVLEIGKTIIDRADEIACSPLYVYNITIKGEIKPDEAPTVTWEVSTFAKP